MTPTLVKEYDDMSGEGADAREFAALANEVKNIGKRAEEDREVITETRDTAKSIESKMDNVTLSLAASGARLSEAEKNIISHDQRITVLESKHGLVGKVVNTVWVAIISLCAAAVGSFVGSMHHIGK
jgi:septal ring factor EnvC (AmiA/AmiB activator)